MAVEKFLQAAARRRVVEKELATAVARQAAERRSKDSSGSGSTAEALRKLDRIMSAKLGGEAAEQGEQRRQSGSRSSRGPPTKAPIARPKRRTSKGATRPAAEDEENDPLRLPKRRQMSVDRPPRESSMARSRSRTPTNLMNNTTPRSSSKSKQQQPTTVTTPKSSKTSRSPTSSKRPSGSGQQKKRPSRTTKASGAGSSRSPGESF
jgi:hypothetical protein